MVLGRSGRTELCRSITALCLLITAVAASERASEPQGPVFLSEPPTELEFSSKKGAQVDCTVFGRPAPVLDWVDKDGKPLDNIPGILIVRPNNTLYFPPFQDADFRPDVHTTSYRCLAKNKAGAIVSRQTRVKAVLETRFLTYSVQVNDVYVTRGNTAVFRCNVNPHYVRDEVKVIQWKRGKAKLRSGGRFSILSNGDLHMRNVQEVDSYHGYSCITRNIITGESKQSDAPARLYVIDSVNSAPSIEEQDLKTRILTTSGNTVELPCVASGYPVPSYSWSKNGRGLSSAQVRVQQNGGNLLLEDVNVGDSGLYECLASNDLGTKKAVVEVIVTSKLSAVVEPSHTVVDQGKPVTFNCTVYGNPVSAITWVKNGKPLELNSRVTVTSQTVLRIRDVQRKDLGMYQCLVSNSQDNAQGAAQLSLGVEKPIISQHFEDQFIKPGSSISLKCVTSGNPLPMIRWTVDDTVLPDIRRIRIGQYVTDNSEVVSYINISNVQVEDGGQYKCTSTNEAGTAEYTGQLNVYGLPFIRPMHNVTAVAGEATVIRCHVSGYPIESIVWSKGLSNLPVNHRQQIRKDGTLTINNVQGQVDSGKYTCTATNMEGQSAARSVFITVLEPPKIDPFQFPERKQGDRVSISCVVSQGDLPIKIRWTKDGQEIPHDMGVIIQKTGPFSSLLSIGHTDPSHNGNYTCTAENDAASVSYTAQFHVDVPPRWVSEPQDSFVVLGRMVVIDCQSTGTPQPAVTWKKAKGDEPGDYQDIVYDDITGQTKIRQYPNGSLVIRDANTEDHGYYLCHSSNGVGPGLSKVVMLTVHVPARIVDTEKNYTVKIKEDAILDCFAEGDSPMSMTWSFNGGSIDTSQGSRFRVDHYRKETGVGSKLIIPVASRNDNGFYVCNAKNMFGFDTLVVDLLVQEKPEPPSGVSIKSTGSRKAKVFWEEGFDGNSRIMSYVIEYKTDAQIWGVTSENVTVSKEVTEAEINNMQPAQMYQVRVRAQNTVGLSAPSLIVQVTTSEEVPSGPPTNVVAVPIDPQALRVTWKPPKVDKMNGKIKGYYIGYKVYNASSPYMYVTVPIEEGQKLEINIDNLEKFTQYAVHVQAYNRKGAGPKSEDVAVLTLEDVPSQPPQNVHATPLSSQSVMIIWTPPPLYTLHGILQGYKILYKPVRADEDETDAMTIISKDLSVAIYGLEKYTNYSVEVLAFTRRGEGVRSRPIYVRTQQDIPDRPADVKALAASETSILLTWKPPLHPNGIITKYTVLIRDTADPKQVNDTRIDLQPFHQSYKAVGLDPHHKYVFHVGASTIVGDGEFTQQVSATPMQKVAARIASFWTIIYSPWQSDVILPCEAVGDPAPVISWQKRGQQVALGKRMELLSNGSLWLHNVRGSDAANYTCRAENIFGADEIQITLIVQAPPKQPSLHLVATTTSSIQVSWRSGSNGGSKLQGFSLFYKREHSDWTSVQLGPQNRSYTAMDLRCGTPYKMYLKAYNKVGEGRPSETVSARTNGSRPIMPAQSLILKEINSTFVLLDMATWQDGGCPVERYEVQYRYWRDDEWHLVENSIKPNVKLYRVDLRPATWYVVRVTAFNPAGSTDCILRFATKTFKGATIQPIMVVQRETIMFWEKIHVMVPLTAGIVSVFVFTVAMALYCRRRQEKQIYKENASNLRRDLTAETSLMSELNKEQQMAADVSRTEGTYSAEPRPTNINILGGSNMGSNSDNSLNNAPGEESGINPYATFEYPTSLNTTPTHSNMRGQGSPQKNTNLNRRDNGHSRGSSDDEQTLPPPPPELLRQQGDGCFQTPPTADSVPQHRYQNIPKVPLYQNQDLILNPRKYTVNIPPEDLYARASRPPSYIRLTDEPPHGQDNNLGHRSASASPDASTLPRVRYSPPSRQSPPEEYHTGPRRKRPASHLLPSHEGSSHKHSRHKMEPPGSEYEVYDPPSQTRHIVTPNRRLRNQPQEQEMHDVGLYSKTRKRGPPVPPRRSSDPTSPGADECSPLVENMGKCSLTSPAQYSEDASLMPRQHGPEPLFHMEDVNV